MMAMITLKIKLRILFIITIYDLCMITFMIKLIRHSDYFKTHDQTLSPLEEFSQNNFILNQSNYHNKMGSYEEAI